MPGREELLFVDQCAAAVRPYRDRIAAGVDNRDNERADIGIAIFVIDPNASISNGSSARAIGIASSAPMTMMNWTIVLPCDDNVLITFSSRRSVWASSSLAAFRSCRQRGDDADALGPPSTRTGDTSQRENRIMRSSAPTPQRQTDGTQLCDERGCATTNSGNGGSNERPLRGYLGDNAEAAGTGRVESVDFDLPKSGNGYAAAVKYV